MKKLIILTVFLALSATTFTQTGDTLKPKVRFRKEPQNNWSMNLTFSDNGFGAGATKYFTLSRDISLQTGILFSGAKDDREFEQYDFFGNSVTPFKVNRLFMFPIINLGMQYRLFRDDVTSDMRPFINFGVSPAAIVYTPYNESFFSSFRYAGVGLDYMTSRTSGLSFNLRYYYLKLFGEGIQSISTAEMKSFGGIYFIFSYNFVK